MKKLSNKKGACPFIAFWLIGLLVIITRMGLDIKTYFAGSTFHYHNTSKSGYDYLLHLPQDYTDFGGKKPLLIYLHGAGETKTSLNWLQKRDVMHCVKGNIEAKDFPFIVVSPMTEKHGWEPERIMLLLDELLNDNAKRWQIDEAKIYLTGFSMGGFGTFRIACEFPNRFAAIVPVSGGGEVEDAVKLKNVPTYAFHGNADKTVSYDCSKNMIEAMRECNAKEAKLKTLHGKEHGIMRDVYSKPEVWRWMLEKELKTMGDNRTTISAK